MGRNVGPVMQDIKNLLEAGIDPKTHLPIRLTGTPETLSGDMNKMIRVMDEQDAVNSVHWEGLPFTISAQELERLVYYKFRMGMFLSKIDKKFYFMPMVLDGQLDYYGRWRTVHPVPIVDKGKTNEKAFEEQEKLLSTIKLNVVYDIVEEGEWTPDMLYTSCVLLDDFTPQWSQTSLPRWLLNDGLIKTMSEIIPFMRTGIISGTGIKGVRVADADQAKEVRDAAVSTASAAKQGEMWVPIVGKVDFQDLTDGSGHPVQEYLLALQSLDNLRLKTHGLENGGLFEKKAHITNMENAVNQQGVSGIAQDRIAHRQRFCNIANSIWGTLMWCELSETTLDADMNGDGAVYDKDYEGPTNNMTLGEQSSMGGEQDGI